MPILPLLKEKKGHITYLSRFPWAKLSDVSRHLCIAESTGKAGRAILPVAGEDIEHLQPWSGDRLFVGFRLKGDASVGAAIRELRLDNRPGLAIRMGSPVKSAYRTLAAIQSAKIFEYSEAMSTLPEEVRICPTPGRIAIVNSVFPSGRSRFRTAALRWGGRNRSFSPHSAKTGQRSLDSSGRARR